MIVSQNGGHFGRHLGYLDWTRNLNFATALFTCPRHCFKWIL